MKKGACYFLFLVVLFVPFFLSVQAFGQEPYTFVLKWGGTGTGNGQFANGTYWGGPRGIAVDSKNNIYVVDSGNHRIQKFDSQGNYLLQWGTYGLGDGQFMTPKGIAVDKNDNVFVSEDDWQNLEVARVQKFDSEGQFLMKFGVPFYLDSPYSMGMPGGIDFDKDGYLYLVNGAPGGWFQYGVIRKFDFNCEHVGGFGTALYEGDSDPYNFNYAGDIAVNKNGEIYVSVWGEYYDEPNTPLVNTNNTYPHYHSQIKKFDSNFQSLTRWYLDAVMALAIDSDGNVLACSSRDPDMGVYKYDSNGNFLQMIAPNGSWDREICDGEIWWPTGIAIDSDGYVYIVDCLDRVQKFAPPLKKYTFEGFFSPIENTPTVNKANAGQAIPVKWRITDKNGLPISDTASFINITSYRVDCASFAGDPTNSVEEVAAGSSGLQYLGNGWWQYNWKTSKTYAGQCRIMKLTLDDKSEHTASFSFK